MHRIPNFSPSTLGTSTNAGTSTVYALATSSVPLTIESDDAPRYQVLADEINGLRHRLVRMEAAAEAAMRHRGEWDSAVRAGMVTRNGSAPVTPIEASSAAAREMGQWAMSRGEFEATRPTTAHRDPDSDAEWDIPAQHRPLTNSAPSVGQMGSVSMGANGPAERTPPREYVDTSRRIHGRQRLDSGLSRGDMVVSMRLMHILGMVAATGGKMYEMPWTNGKILQLKVVAIDANRAVLRLKYFGYRYANNNNRTESRNPAVREQVSDAPSSERPVERAAN